MCTSVKEVFQQSPSSHKQELCLVQTITYARDCVGHRGDEKEWCYVSSHVSDHFLLSLCRPTASLLLLNPVSYCVYRNFRVTITLCVLTLPLSPTPYPYVPLCPSFCVLPLTSVSWCVQRVFVGGIGFSLA